MSLDDIAKRLREERKKLGMTLAVFAKTGGIGLKTLRNYERYGREPRAVFLSKIATAGADVTYIITGEHPDTAMNLNERELISLYRAAPPLGQKAALEWLKACYQQVMSVTNDNLNDSEEPVPCQK